MDDSERFKLLSGPYVAPPAKRGGVLECEHRGREVRVMGISDGRIQWPYAALPRGIPSLILCGDLIRAVKVESSIAISHWWGVSPTTVWKWRKALGVPPINRGTRRLYEDYHPEKLPDDVASVGRENAKTPEALAKMAAALAGRPAHPNTREGLLRGARKPMPESARAELAERNRRQWAEGGMGPIRAWTPEEDALLGTDLDKLIADRIGRSASSVTWRRKKLGIPRFEGWRESVSAISKAAAKRIARADSRWTPEMDALLGTDADPRIAEKLGVTVDLVRKRRKRLGVPAFTRRA